MAYLQLKIVSRGKTVQDRTLTTEETLILFSCIGRKWNIAATSGEPLALVCPGDVLSMGFVDLPGGRFIVQGQLVDHQSTQCAVKQPGKSTLFLHVSQAPSIEIKAPLGGKTLLIWSVGYVTETTGPFTRLSITSCGQQVIDTMLAQSQTAFLTFSCSSSEQRWDLVADAGAPLRLQKAEDEFVLELPTGYFATVYGQHVPADGLVAKSEQCRRDVLLLRFSENGKVTIAAVTGRILEIHSIVIAAFD